MAWLCCPWRARAPLTGPTEHKLKKSVSPTQPPEDINR